MADTTLARPLGRASAQPAPKALLLARADSLRAEPLVVLSLVVLALFAHGLNMFNFPSFTLKEDEGVYAAQAWAILRQGQLAPYTYTYDHAPGGWALVAFWYALTGGPNAFGGAVEGGRVLMLLLHLAMVPLLYHLARKLGAVPATAALAAFLFAASPLAVFYQRLLLLDSIMLFWALLSLDLLLNGWGSLGRVVLSGACFGLAALSKETAVVLLPAFLVIAIQDRRHHQGRFAVVGWLVPMAMVVTFYPLFALLKGELLPSADATHVSLLGALSSQASRDGGGLLNLDNQFWQLLRGDWLPRDPVLVLGGTAAVLVNLARGLRDRRALATGLLGLLPLLYLGRGGLVLDFYVLAAIPFLCLNAAVALAPLVARLPALAGAALALAATGALVVAWALAGLLHPLYEERPSDVGREALAWIRRHVPADSKIITRDDLWTALREPASAHPGYPNAHSHWKVAQDPAIRVGVFDDTWRSVDYVIMWGRGLRDDFVASDNQVALGALENAHLVKGWLAAEYDEAVHPRPVIELWKVDKRGPTEEAMLARSAGYLSRHFERNGAFVDADGRVTSEAQAYALLRAVWSDDRALFDRALAWTRANLVRRDGLPSWLWQGRVVDTNTASDADADMALALLMAGRHWDDPALVEEGRRMVGAIWEREVAVVSGTPYITAGDWATEGPILALNPSYFAPYAYQVFAEIDPEHDWTAVIDSSYRVLFDAARAPLGVERSAGLPPDWVGLDRGTGALVALELPGIVTTRYSYDAARSYWRVSLHRLWNGDGRAWAFLQQAGFLRDEVTRLHEDGATLKGFASAAYERDGTVAEAPPSIVGTAGALAALLALDEPAAHLLYAGQLVGGASQVNGGTHWGDPLDLYAQEWGWFATALYADRLPDLWRADARR